MDPATTSGVGAVLRRLVSRAARRRLALARRVREHARAEREARWAGRVVDVESLHRREPLYALIAARLERLDEPVDEEAIRALERFLAEPRPTRDDGPLAEMRDARVEGLLRALEGGRDG